MGALFPGSWWIYLMGALALFAAGGGAGFEVTNFVKNDQIKDLKVQQAEIAAANAGAALTQFETNVGKMTAAAQGLTAFDTNMDDKFTNLSKEFANATHAKPLPPDCKPDDVRLRNNASAVALANQTGTAGQPTGSPVRNNP